MSKPIVLSTGWMMPLVTRQIEEAFEVHWLNKISDFRLGSSVCRGRPAHRRRMHGCADQRRDDR